MQPERQSLYQSLAGLFEYPDSGYFVRLASCLEQAEQVAPEVAALLGKFGDATRSQSVEQLQELFTRSFDLNPTYTLEIGWHLFGEDYQRGEFLVKMRQKLRAHNVRETQELPDHFTHALALLDCLPSEETYEFAARFVLPALRKMRPAWQKDPAPFGTLLEAAYVLLSGRFPCEDQAEPASVPELRILQ